MLTSSLARHCSATRLALAWRAAPARGYKSVLKSLRKKLGQHLLKNPDVVKKIVDAAKIEPHETVLEIGPGTGNMTVHILEKAKAVLAVELDERMHEAVNARVAAMCVHRRRGTAWHSRSPPLCACVLLAQGHGGQVHLRSR